jgi:hypothetical protein
VNIFRRLAGFLVLSCIALPGASPAMANAGRVASPEDATASQPPAQIRFTYENPNLQPAKYVLTIQENGSGHYSSEPGPAPPTEDHAWPTQPQDRQIEVSKATLDALFSAARQAKYFPGSCDDAGAKVAFQGKKTLEYEGPNGPGGCTYNWSNSKYIQLITKEYEGIALTLEEGRKLELEHAHARLSLDPELETLVHLAQAGDALELENISPVLSAIAADDAVMQRARSRARTLLDMAKSE